MSLRAPSIRPIALAALLLTAGASQAAITIYTSQAAFLVAITAAATDTFDDLVNGTPYPGPLSRSAGSYTYDASSGPASATLLGAGVSPDGWLSTNTAADLITLDNFATGVYAAGANFFDSNKNGLNRLLGSTVTVTATDASGTVTQALLNPSPLTFLGFVSDGQLLSLTVGAVATSPIPAIAAWPTVNNLTLAGVVPEPETYAMLLAGLAIVGFVARRRRD